MVGWLYADLLLAIAMLFLVFNTTADLPEPTPTPAPAVTLTLPPKPTDTLTPLPMATSTDTPAPRPEPTLTSTPTPRPGGLELKEDVIELKVDIDLMLGPDGAAKRQEERNVITILQDLVRPFGDRRAGMVLAFGTARTGEAQRGEDLADVVTKLLPTAMPRMFPNTVMKPYHQLNDRTPEARGIVKMEIYWIKEQ